MSKKVIGLVIVMFFTFSAVGLAQTGTFGGTVSDDEGNPIAGASVSLCEGGGWWGGYNTQTMEDGSFIIEDVEVGDYNATAHAWGYMMASEAVEILEDETTIVDFVLEEYGGGGGGVTGMCSGTVTDEAGEPLEGVSVSLHEVGGGGGGWGWGNNYQTSTLEDGTFSFDEVEVGDYNASAHAWGYMMASEEIEILEGETTIVDFVLEEYGGGGGGVTGMCSGTVTDEAGEPLEGVSVSLHEVGGGGGGWGWGNNYQTSTLEDGTFSFDEVEVGDYNASAHAWGYMMVSEEVEILEDETTIVDFVLEEYGGGGGGVTGMCSGTVTDEAGEPLEGVSVSLHEVGGGGGGWGWGWGNSYNTLTLEDGTFAFDEVEIGEYEATAFAWSYVWNSQDIEILEGETTIVDFVLESWGGTGPTGTFSGTVSDSAGNPVEGAFVSLHSDCGWGWGWGWGGNWYSTETLEDGSFIIEDVEVGEYTASAFAWEIGSASEEVEILEGETTIIDFELVEWGWGGGWFDVIDLRGVVVVEQRHDIYIYTLDTNGDNRGDYNLNFGPDWYHPPSGAMRPGNGETIEVTGTSLRLNGNSSFVVYEKDNLFWREPMQTNPDLIQRIRERMHGSGGQDMIERGRIADVSTYPNPFNPETSINYVLTDAAQVNIAIYNTLGQQVAQLVDGNMPAGSHQLKWNAVNHSSGFYFMQVKTANQTITRKILLTK